MCWLSHVAVNVSEGALALYDRIKSLIIRPLCVILHSLRHDLIPVLGLASALQSQHMLLPALPRWAPKSNTEPFGAVKLQLIGGKEPSGCLFSTIFISHPTDHINLLCCVFPHVVSVLLTRLHVRFLSQSLFIAIVLKQTNQKKTLT